MTLADTLNSLLRLIAGGPGPSGPGPAGPFEKKEVTMTQIPDSIRLAASKAVEEIAVLDRAYGLGRMTTPEGKENYKHDLSVALAFGDLSEVRLELLDKSNLVLAAFSIAFDGGRGNSRVLDSARGVEVPVLDRRLIATHRIIVSPFQRAREYRHLLRLNWGPAETLAKRPGSEYTSDHHSKVTGGRQKGEFHVADSSRHRLVVTQSGTRGYAFARDLDLGLDGVFLHVKHAPAGFQFHIGQQLTAIVVQSPAGFQGRRIH